MTVAKKPRTAAYKVLLAGALGGKAKRLGVSSQASCSAVAYGAMTNSSMADTTAKTVPSVTSGRSLSSTTRRRRFVTVWKATLKTPVMTLPDRRGHWDGRETSRRVLATAMSWSTKAPPLKMLSRRSWEDARCFLRA
jgi:hypothetical protein